jgi:outer membrane protein assembly factor BamD
MLRSLRSLCRLSAALAGAGVLVCALALPSVPAHAAAPKKNEADEPQRMYDAATKSLNKGYFDEAVTEFEKLRNTYPFSKFAVEAELKIADALFKKREYADAADAYRTFAKLHPKHEQVDYATFRVGLSLFQESPKAVDRDQSSTEKALDEFRAFIQQFPDSKYADEASRHVGEGRDRLAAKELYVGSYYVNHGKYNAAIGRLQNVVDRYPDAPAAVEAEFDLGLAQSKLHKTDAAIATLTAFLEKHPDAKQARDARKLLAKLGAAAPSPKAGAATPTPSPVASPSPTAAPSPSASPAGTPAGTP